MRYIIELLLSLPALPAEKIPGVLEHIRAIAPNEPPALGRLFAYIDRVWINGQWEPARWSVFYRAIRTNNDCEGLHNRWNRKARGRKSYYWILSILIQESKRIESTAQQLMYGCKVRERKAVSKRKEEQMFKNWDDYQDEKLSSFDLVEKSAKLLKRNYPSFELLEDEEPNDMDCLQYDDI